MRKWVLFSLLALAIGVASWWHFSRIPSVSVEELGVEIASSQEWTPEQLRETRGEIVVGGNAPANAENPPSSNSPPPSTTPSTVPITKSAEILAKNSNTNPSASTATPAVTGEESYTVQKGDTLGAIAKKKYGSAAPRYVDAIVKKNSLKGTDALLKIGAKLVLPDPASVKK